MTSATLIALAHLLFPATQSLLNCSDLVPMPNAQTTRLSGIWYCSHYIDVNVNFPIFKCSGGDNFVNSDGSYTTVTNFTYAATNQSFVVRSEGVPVNGVRSLISLKSSADPGNAELSVLLDTDYLHYALWVTCLSPTRYYVLVNSREKRLKPQFLGIVKKKLAAANITGTLIPMQQDNC